MEHQKKHRKRCFFAFLQKLICIQIKNYEKQHMKIAVLSYISCTLKSSFCAGSFVRDQTADSDAVVCPCLRIREVRGIKMKKSIGNLDIFCRIWYTINVIKIGKQTARIKRRKPETIHGKNRFRAANITFLSKARFFDRSHIRRTGLSGRIESQRHTDSRSNAELRGLLQKTIPEAADGSFLSFCLRQLLLLFY